MKKMILVLIGLLLIPTVLALQELAGLYEFNVIPGEITYGCIWQNNHCYAWGLINDEDYPVTLKISADGDAAQYLIFPEEVRAEPHKITWVDVQAYIPKQGQGKLFGTEITGKLYALQEGEPRQVQINIRMAKQVVINVLKKTK